MAAAFDQGWAVGSACFYQDPEDGWVHAEIVKVVGVGRSATLTVCKAGSKEPVVRDASQVELAGRRSLEGVEDMTTLDDLTEATILSTLRARYARQEIYTSVGGILVAVNPYESLDAAVYGDDVMSAAAAADAAFAGCAPHPYVLAETALRALDRDHISQSFVISGESGSGKTETCKYVLRYLSYRSMRRYEHSVSHAQSDARSKAIEESVLLSNPILEAFGNAKTVRNNNSSRWGKYTEVLVQPNSGAIEGVCITSYLLEKVRVVEHAAGERNYHVFYQMMHSAGADVGPCDAHAILGADAGVPGGDARTYAATAEAMAALAVDSGAAQMALAAVLHLGDVDFDVGADDAASVAAKDRYKGARVASALACAASALGVPSKALSDALCTRHVAGVEAMRTAAEAEAAKRAFAKALYARIFAWVLQRVNDALRAMTQHSNSTSLLTSLVAPKKSLTIGLLDIFGFECFETNSLEQLLINFANERLLREFNRAVFVAAAAEYAAEQVSVGDLSFHDNSALLCALEDGQKGIFAQLNSECVRRDGTDDNFLQATLKAAPDSDLVFVPKVRRNSSANERSAAGNVFAVSHFAADVTYNILGFVDKNRDRVPDEICALVADSSNNFIAALFGDIEEYDATANAPRTSVPARRSSHARRFVAAQFCESLAKLTKILDATTQSFVRCVRPNHTAAPRTFENVVVLDQLRCMGMLELVAARGRGYASRSDHATFLSRYGPLLDDDLAGEDGKREKKTEKKTTTSFFGLVSTTADVAVAAPNAPRGEDLAISLFCDRLAAKLKLPRDRLAVGLSKVFVRRDALSALETAREAQLRGDVLIALGEACKARDALQLELTLRIADELRLGESEEARQARSILADVGARCDLVSAAEAAAAADFAEADAALHQHGFDAAESQKHAVVSRARLAKPAATAAELPFSPRMWFAGATWSESTLLCADVVCCARDAASTAAEMSAAHANDREKVVRAAEALEAAQRKRFSHLEQRIEALLCTADAADDDADDAARLRAALSTAARAAATALSTARAALDAADAVAALRRATAGADAPALAAAIAAYARNPGGDGAADLAAAEAKFLEIDLREKLAAATRDAAHAKDAAKTAAALAQHIFAAEASYAKPVLRKELDAARSALERLDRAQKAAPAAAPVSDASEAKSSSPRVKTPKANQASPEAAPSPWAAALLESIEDSAVDAPPPPPPASSRKWASPRGAASSREASPRGSPSGSSRTSPSGNSSQKNSSQKLLFDLPPAVDEESSVMAGISAAESGAIAAETARQAAGPATPFFTEMTWRARVERLLAGASTLKLTATGAVSGADWKKLRLEVEGKDTVLDRDPFFRKSATRASAYLTWDSNAFRRTSRKLALSAITGVHVGTNAKQWCTVVPTEWHYVALTTNERSYDFGFLDTTELLLWANTLQRLVFPEWALQCDAGDVAELFKGAISDAQHRFHRARHAGAQRSAAFDPTMPELCPALYALAPQLERACVDLGVSFAAGAPRPHKYCAWTAVAVLEAPVARDAAVSSMRAVLTDLGFYASGRFACSAGFYDENGLAHTLAQHAAQREPEPVAKKKGKAAAAELPDDGMLIIRAQHAKTGKISVLRIKKGTKMASVFEAHAKHKGLRNQNLAVVKPNGSNR
ncbi:P-loop containing nucleoside triphosphate hydrolase protein [Pelagophyceae sp. CCMP2097]|nr:P-loop containing nucleoside triphosphate hydrolase protein [Pelagophyceae sp. CCMP2097]